MNVLYLSDIDYSKVKKQFDKTVVFLEIMISILPK